MILRIAKDNYTNAIDEYFTLGSQMRQRDTKPVRKTVSGTYQTVKIRMESTPRKMYVFIWNGQLKCVEG